MIYYDIRKLVSVEAQYYVAIGSRGPGKTYQTLLTALEIANRGWSTTIPKDRIGGENNPYPEESRRFMIIRRLVESVKPSNAIQMFNNMTGIIKRLWGYGASVQVYSGKIYISLDSEDKRIDWILIGYCVSLVDSGKIKGNAYNDVVITINDEFINIDGDYIPDEFNKYLNIISTVARTRTDLINFLSANTITPHSPYFKGFGIDTRKLKEGQIYTIKSKKGSTVRLEYTEPLHEDNEKVFVSPYMAFDGSVSEMIVSGGWQIDDVCEKYNGKTLQELTWTNDYKFGISIKVDNFKKWITITENLNNPIIITDKKVGNELKLHSFSQIGIYPRLYKVFKYKDLGNMYFGEAFDIDEFKKMILKS